MRPRFNPRLDPTVLFLEMKNLTLNLDNFTFRIEKSKKRTILDPIFDGRCMVSLQNINIRIRVECAKERGKRSKAGSEMSARTLIVKSWDGAAPHVCVTLILTPCVLRLSRILMLINQPSSGYRSSW